VKRRGMLAVNEPVLRDKNNAVARTKAPTCILLTARCPGRAALAAARVELTAARDLEAQLRKIWPRNRCSR